MLLSRIPTTFVEYTGSVTENCDDTSVMKKVPAASALVSDVTSESERNTAYSLYRIMSNVGWAIGPLTGGFLSVISIGYIFALVTVTSLIQLTVVAVFLHPVENAARKTGSSVHIGLDWRLVLFAAGTFFITLVSSQFSVTLPVYSTKVVGILESNIGYIYAVNGLVVVLGQYPMSWITRNISIVHVMAMGSAFYSFGYFLVAFSHSLYGLMFDMLFITVGENLTSPGMNTVVSQIAPEGKTGRYMGFLSMANSAGRAIGPSIGSFFHVLLCLQRIKDMVYNRVPWFCIYRSAVDIQFHRLQKTIRYRRNCRIVSDL